MPEPRPHYFCSRHAQKGQGQRSEALQVVLRYAVRRCKGQFCNRSETVYGA